MSIPKQNSPPYQSPSKSVELGLDDVIQIRCHKQISCFNVCCRNINLPLTPYDILRLKRRLGLESSEFAGRYATPYPMDCHDLPGLKMNVISGGIGGALFMKIVLQFVAIVLLAVWESEKR